MTSRWWLPARPSRFRLARHVEVPSESGLVLTSDSGAPLGMAFQEPVSAPAGAISDLLHLHRADDVNGANAGFATEDVSDETVGTTILWDDSTAVMNGWGYPVIRLAEEGAYSVLFAAYGAVANGQGPQDFFLVRAEVMDGTFSDLATLPRHALSGRASNLNDGDPLTAVISFTAHLPADTYIDFTTGGDASAFTAFNLVGRVQRIA